MAKATVIGETSGNHLKVTHYSNGTAKMKWNWKVLLEEVRAATADVKHDLVAVTEEKVKKTRKKKADGNKQES